MTLVQWVVFAALMALGGIAAGVLGSRWWAARAAKARRRIPRHWPLDPRTMANSEECKVWRWLIRVFFDHYVMIKVPVTRFTFPHRNQNSAHWYHLLGGVYCTFTICGPDGQVVGCVDVPGRNGISRSNRKLKLTLLSQCGIAYWVVNPTVFHLWQKSARIFWEKPRECRARRAGTVLQSSPPTRNCAPRLNASATNA